MKSREPREREREREGWTNLGGQPCSLLDLCFGDGDELVILGGLDDLGGAKERGGEGCAMEGEPGEQSERH